MKAGEKYFCKKKINEKIFLRMKIFLRNFHIWRRTIKATLKTRGISRVVRLETGNRRTHTHI